MIREKNEEASTIIDLDGPDGNAFNLIGILGSSFRKSGLDPTEIIDEMMSKDYLNVVQTFEKYCGSTFTLETKDKKLLEKINSQ